MQSMHIAEAGILTLLQGLTSLDRAFAGGHNRPVMSRLHSNPAAAGGLDLETLVAGLAAAPPAFDSRLWLRLLASPPDEAEAARLMAQLEAARPADPAEGARAASADRLAALRGKLAELGIEGFLVPLSDAHRNEILPAASRRLAWLTGFTGSAGMAVVLPERAALFVDGRYTLQVGQQIDPAAFEAVPIGETPPSRWLAEEAPRGARIGYDPWLMTQAEVERFEKALKRSDRDLALVPLEQNPVDAVWRDRPSAPLSPVAPHPLDYAGKAANEKRAELAEALGKAGAGAAVLTLPDSIAWLLNVRAGDGIRQGENGGASSGLA